MSSLWAKSPNKTTESDLQYLVNEQICEKRYLEYKRELDPKDRQSIIAQITSMANTRGGLILIGIKANDGIPEAIVGINRETFDLERNRIESLLRDNVKPRLPQNNYEMAPIELKNNNIVLAIRIEESWLAPHQNGYGGAFYARNTGGIYIMDALELRDAFLRTESYQEQTRRFHKDRLGSIFNNTTPVKLADNAKIILHAFPLSAFRRIESLDLSKIKEILREVNPIDGEQYSEGRYNFDGYLKYLSLGDFSGYVQIFRNGCIEVVDLTILRPFQGKLELRPGVIKQNVIHCLQQIFTFFQKSNIPPPVALFLTIYKVAGYAILYQRGIRYEYSLPIEQKTLELPDLWVTDFNNDPLTIVKEWINPIWNAGGLERDPSTIE